MPLLVVLHGLRSQASQIANYAGFEDDAVRRGYVVAYPEGENGTWRFAADSPDVAFVRAVIEQVRTDRCIDAGRVFTSGHSLGAYLSQRMACDAGDLVRASTEYAGGPLTLVGGVCTPRRPISIGLFHGVDDRLVVIPLGRTSRDQWVQRDGCGPARPGRRRRHPHPVRTLPGRGAGRGTSTRTEPPVADRGTTHADDRRDGQLRPAPGWLCPPPSPGRSGPHLRGRTGAELRPDPPASDTRPRARGQFSASATSQAFTLGS
jgi:hypothetical protein